jgi:hypothetical protein
MDVIYIPEVSDLIRKSFSSAVNRYQDQGDLKNMSITNVTFL